MVVSQESQQIHRIKALQHIHGLNCFFGKGLLYLNKRVGSESGCHLALRPREVGKGAIGRNILVKKVERTLVKGGGIETLPTIIKWPIFIRGKIGLPR